MPESCYVVADATARFFNERWSAQINVTDCSSCQQAADLAFYGEPLEAVLTVRARS